MIKMTRPNFKNSFIAVLFIFLLGIFSPVSFSQDNNIEIYGFAMTDMGYNANQIHPDWYDVVRPTKLPSFEDEFAPDGNFFASVRQSRLGVKSNTKTPLGNLFTQFEFEMFGTGV